MNKDILNFTKNIEKSRTVLKFKRGVYDYTVILKNNKAEVDVWTKSTRGTSVKVFVDCVDINSKKKMPKFLTEILNSTETNDYNNFLTISTIQ